MMFPETVKPIKIFIYACLTIILFLALTVLCAAITAGLLNLAQYMDGTLGTFLTDKGPARIMRRALLIGVIIILVFSMKKLGWRGWKDCGWTRNDDGQSSRRIQFGWGVALGFISLGSIAVFTILTGLHELKPFQENFPAVCGTVIFFCLSGISVALIEETICRGILFRVFARNWHVWPAAIIISILFAAAHFIGPNDASFQGSSFVSIICNVSVATVKSLVPPPGTLIIFTNLALLGIVLCAFVMRTKTIWMSVGAHAAWVFIIKFHSYFTDFNPAAVQYAWLGKRNDFMDAYTASFLFIALTFLALFFGKKAGRPVLIGRRVWHIGPSASSLNNFLKSGENYFTGGKILKTYRGCHIVAKDGLVLKKYSPKDFLNGLRFAFRPPKSRRAFVLAEALIGDGVSTPAVLAWSAERRFGLLLSETMIVSEVTNAEPLTSWLERKAAGPGERLKVMGSYGNLMAVFHRHRYSNRDFKHENVMCSKATPWFLWVVDLDGVRKHLFISRRRAGRDLMRVGKSLAALGWTNKKEIAAFFEAYNRHLPPRLHFDSFPAGLRF